MAKRRVNKSEKIREYFDAHPGAKPQEVVEALSKKRIKVTAAAVSQVKWQMANKKGKKGGTRRRGRKTNGDVDLSTLMAAKKLADQMGGIDQARQALDALSKLQD